jgi:hypothetical protein
MPSAATIRLQIESALAHRIPSALTPRPRIMRPVAPTGVVALDELLEGGLPLGAITEMTGPESSGRSSVALSCVSRLTRAGSVCAWIDVADVFDPESAAAAGVDLTRLLWVRCAVSAKRAQLIGEYKFALPEKYFISAPAKHGLHGGGVGAPKHVLKLPDLEQSRSAVLNSLTSQSSQRTYDHAIREFIEWYCSEPRLAFNKTVVTRYRMSLEQRHYASTTINLRLAAVRRLAYEAADCGRLSADLAAGIRRVKGAKRLGVPVLAIGSLRNRASACC